ncbi:MAG: cyclic pyranopterin monophosphate synthase MoaC [Alphaproteobacteria bacterium]|nr:cyclic pyranopterin monophosphate synthase MoaC [Alphaproteobacteria bacterium]
MADKLTHIDDDGRAHMVDVADKNDSKRMARARGFVSLSPATLAAITAGRTKKGDVLSVAELAGIMAAKKTSELIPLCHPLPLSHVKLALTAEDNGIAVEAEVGCTGKTGVEMEALTAVSVACLTVYDMVKAMEKSASIGAIELVEKSGGKSGDFKRDAE